MFSNNNFNADDINKFFETLGSLYNAQNYLKAFTAQVENKLFLNIEDVMKLTGWSRKTVEDLFNQNDFPCYDNGKRKIILTLAFINYFMTAHNKNNYTRR